MITAVLWIVLAFVVILLCSGTGLLRLFFEFLFELCLGWCVYLARISLEMTVDWSAVLSVTVFGGLFVATLHYFGTWLYRNASPNSEAENRPIWRWRWTVMISLMIVLLFVAGIAMIGVTHQTAWLLSSPKHLSNRRGGSRMVSTNNLKHIGLALHNFHSTKAKALPAGATFTKTGQQLHGWQARLLPFIERDDVLKKIRFQKPWYDSVNRPAMNEMVKAFLDDRITEPTEAGAYALSHFTANVHMIGPGPPKKFDNITDGLGNTIMIGGAAGNFKPWGHALNWRDPSLGLNTSPDSFGGPVDESILIGMADGSVVTVMNKISPSVLKALATPNGGEKIDPFDWP